MIDPRSKLLLGGSALIAALGVGLTAWSLVAGDPWRYTVKFALVALFGAMLMVSSRSAVRSGGRPHAAVTLACVLVGLSVLVWSVTMVGR